jgi:phage/plasmid-associated DNA primase
MVAQFQQEPNIAVVPDKTNRSGGFESFEQFQEFVKDKFINGSGIDSELFEACVEFHREVEYFDGGDAETPIHSELAWEKQYSRYSNKDQSLYAAFLRNEDGSLWQAVVSIWDKNKQRPYVYLAPKKKEGEYGDRIFLPPVPSSIRAKVSERYGGADVPMEGSFWDWAKACKFPRVLTEGGKKALSGLSNGYLTIGLYGCRSGVVTKDPQGDKLLANRLHPTLMEFIRHSQSREWLIAFDEDEKATARRAVKHGAKELASVLGIENCRLAEIRWEASDGKGLDDLLVNCGVDEFELSYQEALAQLLTLERAFKAPSARGSEDAEPTLNQVAFKKFFSQERWICANDVLYRWDVNFYREVKDSLLKADIAEFCNSYVEYKRCKPFYPGTKSGAVEEIIKWAKCRFCVDPEKINPPGINCSNGIVRIDWSDGEPAPILIPHSPDEYYTYPPLVKYDPDADTTDCDRLLDCLDPAQQEVLLRNLGASFDLEQVRKRRGREVKILLMCGAGSNGKDSIREVVSSLFGHQGMTSVSLADFSAYDDGRKFALAPLLSSRVNWASENPMTARLDKIQSLKLFATGNSLHAERKGKDHVEFKPLGIGLFNLNDVPSLQGTLEATKTRLAALRFRKIYKNKKDLDPNNPNEMLADPRFAYDTEFIQQCVAPAFLNRMIKGLQDLIAEGIDYECTENEFLLMQKENNHLFQFFEDSGLGYGDGCLSAKDIWLRLEPWYQTTGTLTYNENGKAEWADQARPSDRNIKAINQVLPRISALFPNADKITQYDPVSKNRVQLLKGITFNAIVNNDQTRTINENTRTKPVPIPVPETTEYQGSRTTRTNFPNTWEKEEKNIFDSGSDDFDPQKNIFEQKEVNTPKTGTGGTEPLPSKENCYGSGTGIGTGDSQTGTGGTNTQAQQNFDPQHKAKLMLQLLQSENAGLLIDNLTKNWSEENLAAVRRLLPPQRKNEISEHLNKFRASNKQSPTPRSPLPTPANQQEPSVPVPPINGLPPIGSWARLYGDEDESLVHQVVKYCSIPGRVWLQNKNEEKMRGCHHSSLKALTKDETEALGLPTAILRPWLL